MTIDRYTKAVLTVIAACLFFQCAMLAGRVVEAQGTTVTPGPMIGAGAATPVVVVGWGEMNRAGQVVRVHMKSSEAGEVSDPALPVRLPYTEDSRLPVAIESPIDVTVASPVRVASTPADPISVGITSVRKAGPWEPVRVSVDPQPGKRMPGGE